MVMFLLLISLAASFNAMFIATVVTGFEYPFTRFDLL